MSTTTTTTTTTNAADQPREHCVVHHHPTDKSLVIDEQVHVFDEIPDEAGLALMDKVKEWLSKNELYNKEGNEFLHARMNDQQIYRFCRARQFKFSHVTDMITDYFNWMIKTRPEELRFRDLQDQAATGKVSKRGHDRFGRPVLVLHSEFENSNDYPSMTQHMIWNLEKATRDMDNSQPGPSRYVVILNMSGFSLSSQPPMSVSKEISTALGMAYPERLGTVVVLNAPWLFRGFYTALTVILDSRTKSKIHFVKEHEYEDKLTFLLGENWAELTGLNQPQVNEKTAPGFKPDEWIEACLADDRARWPEEAAVLDAKAAAEAEAAAAQADAPVSPASPSLVIVDAADCQSPSAK